MLPQIYPELNFVREIRQKCFLAREHVVILRQVFVWEVRKCFRRFRSECPPMLALNFILVTKGL
jgi:hypothetical protein